jgi:type I protein arginine methyltransferase
MSLHLPNSLTKSAASESGSESSESDNDQEFGDWVSDTADQQPCRSLFDEQILPNVTAALSHDKSVHGFDLEAVSSNLCELVFKSVMEVMKLTNDIIQSALDFHQRIRLINYIRKEVIERSLCVGCYLLSNLLYVETTSCDND